jgi:hypothetical protein
VPQENLAAERLALLWQNVFAPLFFKDLFSAIRALLRRRSKDGINDGVTYGWHGWLRRRPVDSFFPPRVCEANEDALKAMLDAFVQKLQGGTGDRMQDVAESLAGLSARLEGLQSGLGDAAVRISNSASGMRCQPSPTRNEAAARPIWSAR